MLLRRVTVVCGLLAASSCSLIAKGTGSVGAPSSAARPADHTSHAAGNRPASAVPAVKADSDDPPHVARALERLDKMAEMIAQRDFATYARESRDFQGTFLFQNGWADEKKHDAMKARLDGLDAQAFHDFGGRLVAVGDAKRVLKLDEDAVDAAAEMVAACKTAASLPTTGQGEAAANLAKAVAAYEKAIARVKKIDATAMRYFGEHRNGGSIDVPTELMMCEVKLSSTATQFEDEYAPEVATKSETESGCGVVEWLAEGVQIGAGRFAPYTRTVAGNSFVERLPCNKLAKKNSYPKTLADAAKAFAEHVDIKLQRLVIVANGKPYTQVNEDDLHVYRYQKLLAYSKAFQFAKNPCGDGKVFCEAGGSQSAAAYNRVEHHLARAAVHAGVKPDLCRSHLKQAKSGAAWFDEFHASAVKSGDWIAGATYKTKTGAKLKDAELVAAFAEKAKLADDRLLEKYCTKRAGK